MTRYACHLLTSRMRVRGSHGFLNLVVAASSLTSPYEPNRHAGLGHMQAVSQDVRNLSRFASDAAAMPAGALPDEGMRMQSSSSIDSQLPDNAELQASQLSVYLCCLVKPSGAAD